LLGPGPRLIKKNLPGRGLTKVEKHCSRLQQASGIGSQPTELCVITFLGKQMASVERSGCLSAADDVSASLVLQ
jgi:hypothetical protein